MTSEELQQIQAIIQAAVSTAVAPLEQGQHQLATRLDQLEQGQRQLATQIMAVETRLETKIAGVEARLETKIAGVEATLRSELQATEQRIMTKLNDLEQLSAHYQDKEIRNLRLRVRHIEQHLQITPAE